VPKVSVIIPCYNLGVFLDEAIASVWAQTFTDYEIIVVDDGSDDPVTLEKLAELKATGLQIIKTDNHGVSAARNRGISEAHGKYILPLDADDRIAATYLEKAVDIIEQRPDIGIVYCEAELFGALQGPWVIPGFSLPHQLLDNLIFSAALFRKVDWKHAGGYDETLRAGWEDWDFWLRILESGCGVYRLSEALFNYRIRPCSREQSLGVGAKLMLMVSLVGKHRKLYLKYGIDLVRIILRGTRRRPASIKI